MTPVAKRKPRTQPPEKRRDDLMNSAENLFLKHGILGTTIEQITLGADLSKGAFYLHFASKEEVHLALSERFLSRFNDRVLNAITERAENDWSGKVIAWSEASVDGLLEACDLVNMLFHAQPIPPSSGTIDIVIAPLLEVLEGGSRDGAWKLDDCRFTAVFLYSGLHGVVDDALLSGRHPDRDRLLSRVEATCRDVLAIRQAE
ncbi:TetR/AcrR family transcriptional regulator [Ensifer sp. NPDC090286]|uniref:TetR/AcrR family transcriptional regulator n=1 Tax=Ensifer sp. NPDC090286 TaxID=3363991 RepID=UPI00383ABB67